MKALLTGAAVAALLASAALVSTQAPDVVLAGRPIPGDAVVPHPLGDSARSGRGVDLAGMPVGANPPSAPPAVTTTAAPPPVAEPPRQQPGTVRLPGGGVATLVREEVTADGVLPIPEALGEATWWGVDLGAAEGATVLAGHVNWKGLTGPFDVLWRASVGQDVTVVDTAGRTFRFRVSKVEAVRKDDLPSRAVELFGPRGAHRLVLVTCGGRWVGGDTGYEENQVVTATPVP
ncbi:MULTISPECIES: class F sortase [Saccharothrix]|uniref:class F sortase n=1 Tax=Saccharothrix TaxID=2071 RepID=UPI00093DCF7B|nr:class F sortase [Saccharothrix sp. CB00851]OKI21503.1 peptidase C60 sortase A and B [Saccharothrix sp. CB00851]